MEFATLGSGSRGNCTVVRSHGYCILVDCGFSYKELERRLWPLGLKPADISDILVTHEHSDHLGGVALTAARTSARVHISSGTCGSALFARRPVSAEQLCIVNAGDETDIGPFRVAVVGVPHDAAEPVQFTLTTAAGKLGIISDLGHVPAPVVTAYQGCNALLLEHNHDVTMLANGPYPYPLKKRVGGDLGHLSNLQAASFLREIMHDDLVQVIATHLSEKNNDPALVRDCVEHVCGVDLPFTFRFASQHQGSGWYSI